MKILWILGAIVCLHNLCSAYVLESDVKLNTTKHPSAEDTSANSEEIDVKEYVDEGFLRKSTSENEEKKKKTLIKKPSKAKEVGLEHFLVTREDGDNVEGYIWEEDDKEGEAGVAVEWEGGLDNEWEGWDDVSWDDGEARSADGSAKTKSGELAQLLPHVMAMERSALPPLQQHDHDDQQEDEEFDFIIVGAGAAGCALANRLTEDIPYKVLLLEAGDEEVPIMDVPFLINTFHGSDVNWGYRTVPQKHMCTKLRGKKCDFQQGRAVGGCTVINYMFNVRGNRKDYDAWAAAGNEGWDYDSLLPYFQRVEQMEIPELRNSPHHSTEGNVKINYSPYQSPLSKALIRAYKQAGVPEVDYNGAQQVGVARMQTTTAQGVRWSAARAYLRAALARRHLTLRSRSLATRVLFEGDHPPRAVGVEYVQDGVPRIARARHEVIVAAGAVGSAKLLLLSGIGPRGDLEEFDIPVVSDLLVGYNLQDHVGFPVQVLLTKANATVAPTATQIVTSAPNLMAFIVNREGPITTPGGFETISFSELKNTTSYNPGWPPIEVLHESFSSLSLPFAARAFGFPKGVYKRVLAPLQNRTTWMPFVVQLRPHSRGRVWLRSADPRRAPAIDPRGLSDPRDRDELLAGIKEIVSLLETPALRRLGAKLHSVPLPGCEKLHFASDAYWRCAMHGYALTAFHPVGTVKMGAHDDPAAVVTPDLCVRGVDGLRVADSSVMPLHISGHPQIATYMIAEKAADMIKAKYTVAVAVAEAEAQGEADAEAEAR